MRLVVNLLFCLICFASCQKEDIDVWKIKSPEELESNYVEIRENTLVFQEEHKKGVKQLIERDIFIVDKDVFKECKVGDVLVNTGQDEGDTLSYFKKILQVVDEGNQLRFVTKDATLAEAYKKYYFHSNHNKTHVVSRSIFQETFSVNQSFGPLDLAVAGGIDPSFNFNITNDSFVFISSYDEDAGTPNNLFGPTRIELRVRGLRADLQASVSLYGKIEGKFEKSSLPIYLFPIGATGLFVYLVPKAEATATIEGSITSPSYVIPAVGPYNIDFAYDEENGVTRSSMTYAPRLPSIDLTTWTYDGKGNIEIKGGAELVISTLGGAEFAKCGAYFFFYADPNLSHKGSFQDLTSRLSIDSDVGIGAQLLAEFNFFGGSRPGNIPSWFPDQYKLESPDIRQKLFELSVDPVTFCTFSSAGYNYDGSNMLNISASRTGGSGYKLFINDVAVNGGQVFPYGSISNVSLSALPQLINQLRLQDATVGNCYLTTTLADPSILPDDCTETVTDLDGNTYCAKTIGNRIWMVENLRYKGPNNIGKVYGDPQGFEREATEKIYGRLYTFPELTNNYDYEFQDNPRNILIQGICPFGWRIPNLNDWNDLRDAVGGWAENGKNLKLNSRLIWPTGDLPTENTFGAVAGGEYYSWAGEGQPKFGFLNKQAFYWTGEFEFFRTPIESIYQVINLSSSSNNTSPVYTANGPAGSLKSIPLSGYSCRCVKN
ncbi:MAG: FISUMP domain-containing protein [Saprospiraceae bacterium]|nr:hypothetical protein [Saprospiraceae bacterium]